MTYASGVARLPTGGFTGPLLVCDDCGAAVVDQVVHDAFHAALSSRVEGPVRRVKK